MKTIAELNAYVGGLSEQDKSSLRQLLTMLPTAKLSDLLHVARGTKDKTKIKFAEACLELSRLKEAGVL